MVGAWKDASNGLTYSEISPARIVFLAGNGEYQTIKMSEAK